MGFNIRIGSKIFYSIVLAGIVFTTYVFVFSSKGFFKLDSKKAVIENKIKKIEELNRKKIQISNNIERLKTDKEYILSYAKTFGYLDESKNEKIIKIIKNNRKEKRDISNLTKDNNSYINIKAAFTLAFMIALCFISYILLINKNFLPKFRKRKIIPSRG